VSVALSLQQRSPAIAVSRPGIEELFTSCVDFVWRNLYQLGVAEVDLEDQTQEVFLIAHRRYASWNGGHPRAWLYAIARRCASAYRRRGHRRYELCVYDVPENGMEPDPSERFDVNELDRALDGLEEGKRAVFILFEIEELPMREVAAAVGCPVQTAYARLYAARRELARALSEE